MICYYCNQSSEFTGAIIRNSYYHYPYYKKHQDAIWCQNCNIYYIIITENYIQSVLGMHILLKNDLHIYTSFVDDFFGNCRVLNKDQIVAPLPNLFTLTHSLTQIKEKANLYLIFS